MQTGCLKQKHYHFDFDRPKSRLKSYNSLHLNEEIPTDVYVQIFRTKTIVWKLSLMNISSVCQSILYGPKFGL